jgi:hypothetical protein
MGSNNPDRHPEVPASRSFLKEPRLLSKYKIRIIEKTLENRMILMLKNRKGVVVAFNGDAEEGIMQRFIARTPRGTFDKAIVTFGVSSSSASMIDVEYALRTIHGRISRSLDARDVQSTLFRNFLCYYLKRQVYDTDNEEAIGMSFLVVQLESAPRRKSDDKKGCWFLAHLTVDHLGEHKFLETNKDFHVLACTSATKKQNAIDLLTDAKIKRLSVVKLGKVAESVLKDVFGYHIETQTMVWPF